jgi:hypothetical protein
MPDAPAPTPEPTIANLMREVLALRSQLVGLDQRVYQCQCMLVRIDGSLAAWAPASTISRPERSPPLLCDDLAPFAHRPLARRLLVHRPWSCVALSFHHRRHLHRISITGGEGDFFGLEPATGSLRRIFMLAKFRKTLAGARR